MHFPVSLEDQFEPVKQLGAGTMGAVFLAKDRQLGRPVAIKVIAGIMTDEREKRFLREAASLVKVRNPHVVEVYDFGTLPEGPYLVLEYLEGTSLDELEEIEDPLECMLQVAEALEEVHAQGLVHRDLKPANIMRTNEGRAVLVDFGLTQDPAQTAMTLEGNLVGTLAYMPPEALRMEPWGPASDWYSWGACLYKLLEGRIPFDRLGIYDMSRGGERPEVVFSRIDPEGATARLVLTCLDPDPDRRPTSRKDAERLLRPSSSRSSTSRPAIASKPETGRWRSKALGIWLGIGVLFGVLLPGLRTTAEAPPPTPPPPTAPPPAPSEPAPPPVFRVPEGFQALGRSPRGFEEYLNPVDGAVMVLVPGDPELPPFLIDKYEVTVGRWKKYLDANGLEPRNPLWGIRLREPDHPMGGVSWDASQEYARWAGGRLPTRAEWVKAAGGADGRKYPWGNEEPTELHANFMRPGARQERLVSLLQIESVIVDVGSLPIGSSPYGLADMGGNIAEWIEDELVPPEGWKPVEGGEYRACLGGSWFTEPEWLVVGRMYPGLRTGVGGVGLRKVVPLEP